MISLGSRLLKPIYGSEYERGWPGCPTQQWHTSHFLETRGPDTLECTHSLQGRPCILRFQQALAECNVQNSCARPSLQVRWEPETQLQGKGLTHQKQKMEEGLAACLCSQEPGGGCAPGVQDCEQLSQDSSCTQALQVTSPSRRGGKSQNEYPKSGGGPALCRVLGVVIPGARQRQLRGAGEYGRSVGVISGESSVGSRPGSGHGWCPRYC